MDYNSLKYLITVDNYQSISKAAEELYLSQPNISKAIQNVEKEVGFPIFIRSAKGVTTTHEGKEFLKEASVIVNQFENFANGFITRNSALFSLNISYPRATYIAFGVSKFINTLTDHEKINFGIYETNSNETINYILKDVCGIGIIRYNEEEAAYMEHLLQLHNLTMDTYYNYEMQVIVDECNPLANKKYVTKEDLKDSISIVHANPEINDPTFVRENFYFGNKIVKVLERGSQFTILASVKNAYMFISPVPEGFCESYHCKTIQYHSKSNNWHDAFIYKKSHILTRAEKSLMEFVKSQIQYQK